MGNDNGRRKPPMDMDLLTPNDWRRLRANLNGQDLDGLLDSRHSEDVVQVMILGFKLREDPAFTWEQAGDIPPAEMFDLDRGGDARPPSKSESPGPTRSKPKRPADASAPN